MQLEVIRLLVDALNDSTHGVLAQLAALPKDVGDTVTTDLVIKDITRDDALAKGEQVARGDAEIMLLVAPDGPTVTQRSAAGPYSHGSTPISVLAVHRGNAEPAKKTTDVDYVLRSCVLTMNWYFNQQRGDGGVRTRNQVTVLGATGLSYGLVADDGLGALGAVVFTVESLDKRAQQTV